MFKARLPSGRGRSGVGRSGTLMGSCCAVLAGGGSRQRVQAALGEACNRVRMGGGVLPVVCGRPPASIYNALRALTSDGHLRWVDDQQSRKLPRKA